MNAPETKDGETPDLLQQNALEIQELKEAARVAEVVAKCNKKLKCDYKSCLVFT